MNSISVAEDKNYLLYSLTANQDYYISVSGVENNSYDVKPTLPSELITLVKNIGNQTYYIVVYPKSETALGSYTMYVEEPFALISVE